MDEPTSSPGLQKAPPPKAVARRAGAALRERFGTEPVVTAIAPGRVNLIGDHTDYNGGFVLPMAIDRVCAVAAAPGSRAGRWRIHSADLGQDAEINMGRMLEPGAFARGLWTSYIAGVAAGFQALLEEGELPPLDIAIASSIPPGGGLASSAALEVAVATMLEGVLEVSLDPLDKALLCQKAEHEFAGVPCGLMDQLASIHGKAGHALLIDCRDHAVKPIRLPPPAEAAFLVIDSGTRHALAAGEYAARRCACESAARKFGVASLRDLDSSAGGQHLRGWHGQAVLGLPVPVAPAGTPLTEDEARCVRHVLTENARVLAAAEVLRAADLPRFGALMRESHGSLRDDYRVSCPEVDAIVETFSADGNTLGARITGAGFGGVVLVLAHPSATIPARYHEAAFIVAPAAGATRRL